VIADARKCRATDIFKLNGHVYAFDSTTIELCLNAFKWAVYRKNQGKGGIKVHTLYDIETSIPTFFHITEARVNDMNAMDAIPYEENKRKFIFFTNAFAEDERLDISPMMVAELYRNRWQIELFFKWMKQHLKIKKFWGETENAVRIQIYSAQSRPIV
jgi:IS4 transposase